MNCPIRRWALGALAITSVALGPLPAQAQDLGTADAADVADLDEPVGIQPSTTPSRFACATGGAGRADSTTFALLPLAALALLASRRRRPPARPRADRARSTIAVLLLVPAVFGIAHAADSAEVPAPTAAPPAPTAAPPPPASVEQRAATPNDDFSILAPTGKPRHFALTYSPLTLLLARYGLTLDIVPTSHHGITLTAFYAYTRTNEDSYGNLFKGYGGELGYRYYFGHRGPRGLFLGPSLLLGSYQAVPRLGDTVSFLNWGAAADIGWQATVIDRVALGIAAGVQYTDATVKLPLQELPAAIYANRSVMPRLNVWLGVAF